MTVYVDDMRARLGSMRMCHMLADTEEEMHALTEHGPLRLPEPRLHPDLPLKARGYGSASAARVLKPRVVKPKPSLVGWCCWKCPAEFLGCQMATPAAP
ncbi:DUF4031 domain-containing protein [Halomonas coralii]|nr:DUF4031 domain-containing protein [Modicisalibacter sp. MOD 31.J]